ncbi:MAG: arsenate reductase (glutaredoxin) [Gammaproteobacteria bacterium]|nr:arsenate reductase (glutaredoxin) [Gammaproteobacteria bacterium]
MSSKVTIYHNPRCSKSRQTMELLHSKSIQPEVIEYLNTPADFATLDTLLSMLKIEPRQLMRKGEAEYKENNLSDESLTREQLIDAMVKFPKLMERPIVVKDGKAAIGRPPERVLEIL